MLYGGISVMFFFVFFFMPQTNIFKLPQHTKKGDLGQNSLNAHATSGENMSEPRSRCWPEPGHPDLNRWYDGAHEALPAQNHPQGAEDY